jgi:hypothetical protein
MAVRSKRVRTPNSNDRFESMVLHNTYLNLICNQSPAEGVVREIRRRWYRVMFRRNVPKIFWDYGLRWVCETISRTHTRSQTIDGGIPLEKVTGENVGTSNYLDFGFYDHVVYRDNAGLNEPKIGRWLGVAKNVGTMMTIYVLIQTGQVVLRSSVERVKEIDKQTDEMKSNLKVVQDEIKHRLKLEDLTKDGDKPDPHQWADLLDSDPDFQEEILRVCQDDGIKEADETESKNERLRTSCEIQGWVRSVVTFEGLQRIVSYTSGRVCCTSSDSE